MIIKNFKKKKFIQKRRNNNKYILYIIKSLFIIILILIIALFSLIIINKSILKNQYLYNLNNVDLLRLNKNFSNNIINNYSSNLTDNYSLPLKDNYSSDLIDNYSEIFNYNYSSDLQKINSFIAINQYISLCRKGELKNKNQKISLEPKITALVPIYNGHSTIKTTIRSIQNQKMTDIEIILINDCSTDNSLELLDQLQKEDERIKIIKNKINRGILYSRSIGVLNAKGKYVMFIDQDDLFTENIFNICYIEAIKNNLDIVEFSGLNLNNYLLYFYSKPDIPKYLRYKNDGLFIKKPYLSTFMYNKTGDDYNLIDALIWGKCIKLETYKNALNLLGEDIYSHNVCWSEDRIVNFALLNVAYSFKYIGVYGIIHQRFSHSVGISWEKNNKKRIIKDEFLYIMSLYKVAKDSDNINIAFYEYKNLLKFASFRLTNDIKDYFKEKILSFEFIKEKDKQYFIDLIK